MVFFPRAGVEVTVSVRKEGGGSCPLTLKPQCTECKKLWTESNVERQVLSLKWENLACFGLDLVVRYVHDL